jgi:hypothetical protein
METKQYAAQQLAPRLDVAKRDACLHALGAHHAAGRLSIEELDSRIQAALAAETEDELHALTADLGVEGAASDDQQPGTRARSPQRAHLHGWVAAYVASISGGVLVAAAGPRRDEAEFAAGLAAGLVGFASHWALTRWSAGDS